MPSRLIMGPIVLRIASVKFRVVTGVLVHLGLRITQISGLSVIPNLIIGFVSCEIHV